jgi:hypothetical protein
LVRGPLWSSFTASSPAGSGCSRSPRVSNYITMKKKTSPLLTKTESHSLSASQHWL